MTSNPPSGEQRDAAVIAAEIRQYVEDLHAQVAALQSDLRIARQLGDELAEAVEKLQRRNDNPSYLTLDEIYAAERAMYEKAAAWRSALQQLEAGQEQEG